MLTRKQIAQVNREYRQKDESHLWPICNKFNVTNRAIRKVRRNLSGYIDSEYSYRAILDITISGIVNDRRNW